MSGTVMKVFLVLCLIGVVFESNAFRIKAYFPPLSAKRESRLILSGTLPPLREVTVCHWVKALSMKPKGMFIVSYAHGQAADELLTGVVVENKQAKVVFAIRNTTVKIPLISDVDVSFQFLVGSWYHLCITWSSGNGQVQIYVNGIPSRTSNERLQVGEEIRSGGILMIGQDQDVYNGKMDLAESWDGYIAEVEIWDERLEASAIQALAKCEQRDGNVFAWMRDPLIAEDGVVLSRTSLCSHK